MREFFAAPRHAYSREILQLHHERGGDFPPQVPEGTEALVEVDRLTKDFPVRGTDKVVHAIGDFRLTLRRGEAIGLVGESGSGKTTVGRCLTKLEEPTTSEILFDGIEIGALNQREMRRYRSRIQIVFQDPFDSVNPRWTIQDIIEEPLRRTSKLGKAERHRKAVETMELVGLDPELLSRKPRGLGAGTLQRVSIARALICEPEFIVLDEPTSVLAPRARNALIELLAKLQEELGISLLFISHDLTTVRYVCQRVAVMYLGQIVEEGTVEEVFTAPQHPYSQALLSAHLFPDPENRRVENPEPSALEGEIPSPIDLPTGCYLASRCPHANATCKSSRQDLTLTGSGRSVRCHRAVAGELPRNGGH